MLMIERVVVGPLASNSYLVFDPVLREGILIDAGGDPEKIMKSIEQNKVEVKAIYVTHGHFDHVLAVGELKRNLGCKFYIHRGDLDILRRASENCRRLTGEECPDPPSPDDYVEDHDMAEVGGVELRVLHTPGHTPGSVAYVVEGSVFTGDTLFAGAIGRHDLPGGNLEELIRSIEERLLTLPDDYGVYPGHGPSTTIGAERLYNPFIGMNGLYRRRKD